MSRTVGTYRKVHHSASQLCTTELQNIWQYSQFCFVGLWKHWHNTVQYNLVQVLKNTLFIPLGCSGSLCCGTCHRKTSVLVHEYNLMLWHIVTNNMIRGVNSSMLVSAEAVYNNLRYNPGICLEGRGEEVQFTLWPVTKEQKGSRGTTHSLFHLGAWWGWWLNPCPTHFTPQEWPNTHCKGRLGGPQDQWGQVWKISPPLQFDSQTVQRR
jgi:hypothetical protein